MNRWRCVLLLVVSATGVLSCASAAEAILRQVGRLLRAGDTEKAIDEANQWFTAHKDDLDGGIALALALGIGGYEKVAAERVNLLIQGGFPIEPVHTLALDAYVRAGMDPLHLEDRTFWPGDLRWLARAHLYWRIAEWVGGSAGTQRETARRLLDFVFLHVIPSSEQDRGGIPEDVLMRGFGVCDRSGWTLVELLRQAGIRSHLVYLYPPGGGPSSHTVVQAHVDGAWQVFDTLNGLALTHPDDGRPLNVYDIGRNASLTAAYPSYASGTAALFGHCDLALAADPMAGIPRLARLEPFVRKMGLPLVLHVSWEEELRYVNDTLRLPQGHGKAGTPAYRLTVWHYPMQYLIAQPQGGYDVRGIRAWRGAGTLVDGIRAHLMGRFDQADAAYAIAEATDTYEAEVVRYRRGLLDFDRGQFASAIDRWTPLLNHPVYGGPRLHYLIGRCHQALGHRNEAIAAYRQAKLMDAAVIRLRALTEGP